MHMRNGKVYWQIAPEKGIIPKTIPSNVNTMSMIQTYECGVCI